MVEQVEMSSFDLRYESCRMKNPAAEKSLLTSILLHGIRDPLQGVDTTESRILLNGFKRYRCAQKLAIEVVPYFSLGSDEVLGIINLLRVTNCKRLTIIEQARLIDKLKTLCGMSISEIAGLLEKSKGWVGMRVGLLKEMSQCVMDKIFSGQFPAYSYMYTLRKFIRMNTVKKEQIEEFVDSVSGKNLSIRDIELLAHEYFTGSVDFREQIKSGNVSWGLSCLKEEYLLTNDCTQLEQGMLRVLEAIKKYMQRFALLSRDNRLQSNCFFAQANLLAGEILKQKDKFYTQIEAFYDKSGQT